MSKQKASAKNIFYYGQTDNKHRIKQLPQLFFICGVSCWRTLTRIACVPIGALATNAWAMGSCGINNENL